MPTRIETQAEPIPGYRLIERLGGGGFGEVWKAEAPGGLLKAIKFVYGDMDAVDSSESARADQEFKSLQRILQIRHPFILSLERWDKIDGQLMIVTELADKNLWDRYRECRAEGKMGIPRDELLGYLLEAAEALDMMNKTYNLLHLDVKPQNLFLVGNHVKVADFGLVKTIEGVLASVTGGVTPVYAAPETFDGKVTRASDQYSLAIVYQELLTGARPFTGNNTRHLIMQHLEGKPNLDPLPPEDRPIIARALSKDYEKRYACCLDMVQALRSAGGAAARSSLSALEDTSVEDEAASTPTQLSGRGNPFEPLVGPITPQQLLGSPGEFVKPSVDASPVGDRNGVTPYPTPSPAPAQRLGPVQEAEPERVFQTQVLRSQETGTGVLQPALVIGLGAYGRQSLQRLRRELENRFGTLSDLPHLRLLCIDTDPEAAQHVGNPGQLAAEELLQTRLNRPSRYLQTRDSSLPPLETWLDGQMLYRIPRNLVTSGIRALGRLAFVEHYRAIVARLRRDLEQIAAPEALLAAAKLTGETMRATWPRVIIICNLAGGTGGGMFLDLAYVAHAQLRQLGFPRTDMLGLFFLPPAEDPTWPDLSQANAYASLVELESAMTPGFTFRAQYEDKVKPLQDSEPPFSRCLLLPISPGLPEAQTLAEMAEISGRYVQRMLMTPLGRVSDNMRSVATLPTAPKGTSRYQSIGMHVLASPRRAILRDAARRLSQNLLEEWTASGAPDLAKDIQTRVEATLKKHRLDPPTLQERFKGYVVKELEHKPEDLFAAWLEPLRQVPPDTLGDPAQMRQLLRQAEDYLGSAADTNALRQARIVSLARELSERFVHKVSQGLGGVTLQFLDLAGYRLAAADEASRIVQGVFQSWADTFEGQIANDDKTLRELAKLLESEITETERQRGGAKPRWITSIPGFCGVFERYCQLRYEQIFIQRLMATYLSFRGFFSDQVKDLRFCRTRLAEVTRLLEDSHAKSKSRHRDHASLLPEGCTNLGEAAQLALDGLPADCLHALDHAWQTVLSKQFPPLGQLCLTPGDWPRQLRTVFLQEAEAFIEKHAKLKDAAELVLEKHAEEGGLADALLTAYDEAVPTLVEQRLEIQHELGLVIVPDSPAAGELAEAVREALPDVTCQLGGSREELVFYREYVGIIPRDLKQMAEASRRYYEMACSIEHFTPHTRLDVPNWSRPSGNSP